MKFVTTCLSGLAVLGVVLPLAAQTSTDPQAGTPVLRDEGIRGIRQRLKPIRDRLAESEASLNAPALIAAAPSEEATAVSDAAPAVTAGDWSSQPFFLSDIGFAAARAKSLPHWVLCTGGHEAGQLIIRRNT